MVVVTVGQGRWHLRRESFHRYGSTGCESTPGRVLLPHVSARLSHWQCASTTPTHELYPRGHALSSWSWASIPSHQTTSHQQPWPPALTPGDLHPSYTLYPDYTSDQPHLLPNYTRCAPVWLNTWGGIADFFSQVFKGEREDCSFLASRPWPGEVSIFFGMVLLLYSLPALGQHMTVAMMLSLALWHLHVADFPPFHVSFGVDLGGVDRP